MELVWAVTRIQLFSNLEQQLEIGEVGIVEKHVLCSVAHYWHHYYNSIPTDHFISVKCKYLRAINLVYQIYSMIVPVTYIYKFGYICLKYDFAVNPLILYTNL